MDISRLITKTPKTGRELEKLSGLSLRKIRREIEKLQREGSNKGGWIVNLQDGEGYFRTREVKVMQHYFRQEKHREVALKTKLACLGEELKKLEGKRSGGKTKSKSTVRKGGASTKKV